MKLYTDKHQAIVAMISRHMEMNQDTIKQIAIDSGIGRQQIHRWLNGTATKVHNKSLHNIADALGYNVDKTPDGINISHHKKKEIATMQPNISDDIVSQQNDLIKYQRQEILQLRTAAERQKKQSIAINEDFDNFAHDVYEEIHVKNHLNPFAKTMTMHVNTAGQEKMSKALGLPNNNEYMINDTWYPLHEHPMDALILKEDMEAIVAIRKSAEHILRKIKKLFTLRYDTLAISYKYNDKVVHTTTMLKMDFMSAPCVVYAKTRILNQSN